MIGADRAAAFADAAPDTPAVVIDLDVVEANIRDAAARARSARRALRPHVKTHKLPQLARLQLDEGAAGIQVAKLGEAEAMVAAGVDDVLVGYPIVGPAKVARAVALADRCRLTVSLDSVDVAAPLSTAAHAAGVRIGVMVEIDTGLRRVGVEPSAAGGLAERVQALPALDVRGVLTHEGHVYAVPGPPRERRAAARRAYAAMGEAADALRALGHADPVVSVGSSATFAFALDAPGLTELRPGTYVFNDLTQLELGSATPEQLGAAVVTTVVSTPRRGEVVIDAGSKALSSDRRLIADPPATFGAEAAHGWPVLRLSEEHGVVGVDGDGAPRVGDRLVIVPNHICPVVNLFDSVTAMRAGHAEQWPVAARGKVS